MPRTSRLAAELRFPAQVALPCLLALQMSKSPCESVTLEVEPCFPINTRRWSQDETGEEAGWLVASLTGIQRRMTMVTDAIGQVPRSGLNVTYALECSQRVGWEAAACGSALQTWKPSSEAGGEQPAQGYATKSQK